MAGIEAEAELLAALVTFFKAAGLGPQDVGIKVRTNCSRGTNRHNGSVQCHMQLMIVSQGRVSREPCQPPHGCNECNLLLATAEQGVPALCRSPAAR